jgi:hypothetical protein
MSHTFYERLTQTSVYSDQTESQTYPPIAKHQFFALLREHARDRVLREQIVAVYSLDGTDVLFNAYMDFIYRGKTIAEKISNIEVLSDISTLNESAQTVSFYPDSIAIMKRIGF